MIDVFSRMHPLLAPNHEDLSTFAELPSSPSKSNAPEVLVVGLRMDKDEEKHPNDSWLVLEWDIPIMASSLDSELWGTCGCEIHAEPHARKIKPISGFGS